MGSEISKLVEGTTSRYMSVGTSVKDINRQRLIEAIDEYEKI
jgi:hypothetical protein